MMKKLLEIDGGDGCTTMKTYLMPLNFTAVTLVSADYTELGLGVV